MSSGQLTIDLGALVSNYKTLASKAPHAKTSAVLKADAYGLGLEPVALALRNTGVDTFFVFDIEEGVQLRNIVGNGANIYLFGDLFAQDVEILKSHKLIPSVNSVEAISALQDMPNLDYALAVDTGMNRLGLSPQEARDVHATLPRPKLVYSHLYAADSSQDVSQRQREQFKQIKDLFPNSLHSLAATSGILLGSEYHFDMTRPGIGLYGGARFEGMRNVVNLTLPVRQVRHLKPYDTVGYDGTFQAEMPMRIATLAGGYADGILRALSNSNCPLFTEDGTPCPLIGRVSMDSITVDISRLSNTPSELYLYSEFHGVIDVAGYADTISYELLTSLGKRFSRKYINDI